MSDTSPTPTPERRYTIGELAELAGVSRRTVRYYVQRELLPAPDGLGRGAHYDDEHLARLVRIRELQEAGVPLADVPSALEPAPAPPPRPAPGPRSAPGAPAVARWSRAVLADGVELHVRDGVVDDAALALLVRLVTNQLTNLTHPSPLSVSVSVSMSTEENADDDQ